MSSDGIIAINGDGCFLISSSCNKTFLNPSDISFIHCFLELFPTLISNTFSTIQYLSFDAFFTLFDNRSIYKVFSFGYKISRTDTYYLTTYQFWENWCSYCFTETLNLQGRLGCLKESWTKERMRLSECVAQQDNYFHCYIGSSDVVIISLCTPRDYEI